MVRRRSSFSAQNSVSAVTVFKRFVLGSSLAWVALATFLFLVFFDLKVVDNLKPLHIGFNFATASLLRSFFLVLLLNAVCGAVIALPAAAAAVTSMQKLDHLERYTLHKPIFKIFIFQTLPWFLYFAAAFLFVLAGLSAAPQFVKNKLSQGTVSDVTLHLHELIFKEKQEYGKWKVAAPQKVIFQLPASVLSNPALLPKTRSIMGEAVPFILDTQSYPTQVLQILQEKSDSLSRSASPFFETDASAAIAVRNAATNYTKSSDVKSVSLIAGPEFGFLTKKELSEQSPLSIAEFVWKRVFLSQPQLFLIYRSDLLAIWGEEFRWKKLVVEDAQTVSDFMQTVKNQKTPGLHFVQLSEWDVFNSRIKHPLAGIKWPVPSEKQAGFLYNKLDDLLAGLSSALKATQKVDFVIVPYPDSVPVPLYSYMFTSKSAELQQQVTFLSRTLLDHLVEGQENVNDACFPALINSLNKKQVVDLYFKRWSYLGSREDTQLEFVGAKFLQNLIGRDFVGVCFADATYILRWNKRLEDKNSFRHWLFNKREVSKNEKKASGNLADQKVKTRLENALGMVSIYKLDNMSEAEGAILLGKEDADKVVERITPQKVLSTMEASIDFLIN